MNVASRDQTSTKRLAGRFDLFMCLLMVSNCKVDGMEMVEELHPRLARRGLQSGSGLGVLGQRERRVWRLFNLSDSVYHGSHLVHGVSLCEVYKIS